MAGRARLLAGLAVVISGSLAGGAAYALNEATSGGSKVTALPVATAAPSETPTESPSPEPVVTQSPTPSPTPSPTASPTPSPTASPTAGPTPTVTASATPTTKYYPYPSPPRTYSGLTLSGGISPARGTDGGPGDPFLLQITGDDGDGTIFLTSIDWGDGTVDGGEESPSSCPVYPSPTANPGPYQPEPDHRVITRTHSYAHTGDFRVVVRVRSLNADCRPHGPAKENGVLDFNGDSRVHVG